MDILSVRDLSMHFGGVQALSKINLSIKKNEIHGLIGPNGAGKTTLLNCIYRFYEPSAGAIKFEETDLLKLPTHKLSRLGIARSFQDVKIHPEMSILQNVITGSFSRDQRGLFGLMLGLKGAQTKDRLIKKKARNTLKFLRKMREEADAAFPERELDALYGRAGYPDLIDVEDFPAGSLPYAPRKRLDLARSMVNEPKLLLLDEPAAGVSHQDIDELAKLILGIRDQYGTSILIVEHHMELVMRICDTVTVLNFGEVIAKGLPQEVKSNPVVIAAYLGSDSIGVKDIDSEPKPSFEVVSKQPEVASHSDSILEVDKIDVHYGPIQALSGVSLHLKRNSIAAVLGANGAGKSTLLKAIVGAEKLSEGKITFQGEKIADRTLRLKPYIAVRQGLALVPEGKPLFLEMSVKENLLIGGHLFSAATAKELFEKSLEYFPSLKGKLKYQAGSLSGGEQQMLAIAQALMARPRLLLLDEPSLGLSPILVEKVFEIVEEIKSKEDVAILIVEQSAVNVLQIADFGFVLETGRLVRAGRSKDLLMDQSLRQAYLGI